MYMGGLSLMVISPKMEIFALLYVHIVNYLTKFLIFNDFILTYGYKRVIIYKNMIQKSLHSLRNQIQTFLYFWLTIFTNSALWAELVRESTCPCVCVSVCPLPMRFFCVVGLVQSVPRPWTGAISISSRALKTRRCSGVRWRSQSRVEP